MMHTIATFLGRVSLALINLYAAAVALMLLLRLLVGESWPLVALFNSFSHLLLIPALFLLPLMLVLRRRFSSGLLLPAVLAFALAYGTMFVPRSVEAAPAAPQLKLMTYNLHSKGTGFESQIALIRDSDADVIALQELSAEMAAVLETDLRDLYPYQALHGTPENGIPGQGVLSRYPLTEDDYWRMYLAHQRVVFDFAGQSVTLYNEHPIHPLRPFGYIQHRAETDDLLRRTADESGPLLLAGDFNMSDQSADYWRIASRYQDAYRSAGWGLGLTFSSLLPHIGWTPALARLDYVFYNSAFETLEAKVWPHSGGSDHLPVFVTLQLSS